jgi:hypothetical protein
MGIMKPLPHTEIVPRFVQAAGLAGITIPASDIEVQFFPAPHKPPASLPHGKIAVYVFMYGDRCLKVGKAGSKSVARFCNHHYSAKSAPSTLAKSLVKAQVGCSGIILDDSNVSEWIRSNTARINFLFPSSYGPTVLSLFESFVQCLLQPEFEGFASQRVTPNTAPEPELMSQIISRVLFVTYENYSNPHVTIHVDGCSQIAKRGGQHKHGQGKYHKHEAYSEASVYAQGTRLPVKLCSFCNPNHYHNDSSQRLARR